MATTLTPIYIYSAAGFGARLVGWHGFPYPDQVLYFKHCQAVHGFGLRQPLAVRFVDQYQQALGDWLCLKPQRVRFQRGAFGVLEMDWQHMAKRHLVWVAFQQAIQQQQIKRWHWRWPHFGQTHYDK